MKKLLFLFLLLSSVAYGQGLVGTKTTIGSNTIWRVLVEDDIPSLNFNKINTTPTTLSGYGITDAWGTSGTVTLSGDFFVSGSATPRNIELGTASFPLGSFVGRAGGFGFVSSGVFNIDAAGSSTHTVGTDLNYDVNDELIYTLGTDGQVNTHTSQTAGSIFRSALSGIPANISYEWLSKGTGVYGFLGNSTQSTRLQGSELTSNGVNTGTFVWPTAITSNRTWTLPDATGTVAITSDLSSYQPLDGDLTAIAGLSTIGIPQRTAANTWSMLSGTAGQASRINPGGTEWEMYSPIANPATTDEDLIKYNGTGYDRIAVGSNGNILTVTGGVVGWAAPASSSSALSALTAATGTNTINNGANAQTWQWNTLAGASGLTLMSTSTTAASNLQTLFNVALTGANATASQTTYAMAVNNGHTGTSSTNYTGYFTASGGTTNVAVYGSASGGTNNYAGIFENGNVGIGSTAPTRKLTVNATSLSIMGFSRSGTERFLMGISDATNGLITGTAVNDFAYRTNGQQQVWSNDNGTTAHMTLGATGIATLRSINVATGVSNDGGGLKHSRVTTGSVGAGSTALITVTWATAFADANYTVNASVLDATTSSLSLSVVHIESISASAVTVRVLNNAVGSLTGTLHVIAMHD